MEKAYDSGSGRSRGPEGRLIHEQMYPDVTEEEELAWRRLRLVYS